MWNLIKAQNYQLKRDNGIIYIYLIGLAFVIFPIVDFLKDSPIGDLTGSYYGVSMSEILFLALGLLTILLTSRILGWDFSDKTINYELLSGHSRSQVYWSRVITALIWCMITAPVILFVPMLGCSLLNGWGVSADQSELLLRYALVLFPTFRLICECVLLTILLRNGAMAMVLNYVLYVFPWTFIIMAELMVEMHITTQLSSMNSYRLLHMENSKFGYIDGKDVVIYETALESGFLVETIVVSLVVGIICLFIGGRFMKKSDME